MNRLSSVYLALLLVACGSTGPEPLECVKADTVDAAGLLDVTCNHDAPNPPDACTRTAPGQYQCNLLHLSDDECAAFPGACT